MGQVLIDEKDFMRIVKLVNGMDLSSEELCLLKQKLNAKMDNMVKRQNYAQHLNKPKNKETPS